MLSFLRAPHPKLTQNAQKNPVNYESQNSQIEFHPPAERSKHFAMTNVIPPSTARNTDAQEPPPVTILQPPPHFHIYQSERFRIRSGTASFFMGLDTSPIKTVSASTEDTQSQTPVYIPPRRLHRFINASSTEPLKIEIQLDPEDYEASQKFFRNLFGYLDDCKTSKTEPSVFQIMVFFHSYDTTLGLPAPGFLVNGAVQVFGKDNGLRVVEMLVFYVSWLVLIVMAWVGRSVLGYRDTYPEYYEDGKRK